jgi:hypothetical protein
MRIASFLTLSAVVVSAAANASPVTHTAPAAAAARSPIQIADASKAAAVATPAPAAPTTAVAPKKICKVLPSSYSHSQQRVCLTKDEWKQVDEQSRD